MNRGVLIGLAAAGLVALVAGASERAGVKGGGQAAGGGSIFT